MPEKLVELRTETGQPVAHGGITITPQSQALVIHLPRLPWGLVWNRPLAVRVDDPGAPAEMLAVWDVTRLGQLALLGLGILGSLIIRRFIHD